MKEKIFSFAFIFAIIVLGYIIFMLYVYNQDLINLIEGKNKIIEKSLASDSSYSASNKETAEQITKYVSGCNIIINDKEVSTSELIKILSNLYNENDSLRNALVEKSMDITNLKIHEENLHKLLESSQDSTFILSRIVKFAKRDYGIEYKVELRPENQILFTKSIGKADSALWLYPFFKDRIITDSATGKTNIILPNKQLFEKELQDLNKRRKNKH